MYNLDGKTVLITGITGQDGALLAEQLLARGCDVHGVMRRSSVITTERIDHIFDPASRTNIHYGDVIGGLDSLIYKIKPDVVVSLASQSHVAVSFKDPITTGEINGIGVAKLLETIRQAEQIFGKQIRFYHSGSSEMFGRTPPPQNETTYFSPASPYGCSKLYAYWMTKCYRESYSMFAANGIYFNHESRYRGRLFVTRKISIGAARCALGLDATIHLGNLEALRDWSHASDMVRALQLILEADKPDDWVVSSQEYHSVREFGERVFKYFNLDFYKYLVIDDNLKRPNEVPALLGDSTKIRTQLGWKPEFTFDDLIKEMCDHDYAAEKAKTK